MSKTMFKTCSLNTFLKQTHKKSANDLLNDVLPRMSEAQKEIINEAKVKGNAGLSLPMGTGKTILSLLLGLIELAESGTGCILVVVQKLIMTTWIEEIKQFFGDNLKFCFLHSESIKNLEQWTLPNNMHLVITTPEVISKAYISCDMQNNFVMRQRNGFNPEVLHYRTPNNPFMSVDRGLGVLFSVRWGTLIIDEAQNFFNPASKRCCGLASICARRRLLLSGTMLEEPRTHKLMGYYLLLNDAYFPRNLPAFTEYVTSPNFRGMKHTMVIREGNPDFVPPKINKVVVPHPLTETEALIYTNMKFILQTLKRELQRYKDAGDRQSVKKFTSYIMAMISHMRQCLVAPLIPITSVAVEVSDVKVKSELCDIFMRQINRCGLSEWLNDENSLYSSRLRAVVNKLNEHRSEKIIVFSCYRKVLDVLRYYLKDINREIFTISGDHSLQEREAIIAQFRESENAILLLTYDIGANGLNLQCSSVVLLVDFWWNAGKTKQAIARIIRRGQTAKEVTCYYFTSNTGIEKALLEIQKAKLKIADEVMDGHIQTNIPKVDVNEIVNLILQDDNIRILNEIK